jgi:hypothetical protein
MARKVQELTQQVTALKEQANSNATGTSLSLGPGEGVMESSDHVVVRGTELDAVSHSTLIALHSTVTAPCNTEIPSHSTALHRTESHSTSPRRNAPFYKPDRDKSHFAAL